MLEVDCLGFREPQGNRYELIPVPGEFRRTSPTPGERAGLQAQGLGACVSPGPISSRGTPISLPRAKGTACAEGSEEMAGFARYFCEAGPGKGHIHESTVESSLIFGK